MYPDFPDSPEFDNTNDAAPVDEYDDPPESTEPDPPYDSALEIEVLRMEFSAKFQALELANRVTSASAPPKPEDVVARAETYYKFLISDDNEDEESN